ncbi:hypothetical protein ACHQM5_028100 [Ranunculus cassubicifolius]
MGFLRAIEIAMVKDWFPLWVESDSEILVRKIKERSVEVPWQLKTRWSNVLQGLQGKTFKVSHIHREGNYMADALANIGLTLTDFTWWYQMPDRASRAYERNLFNLSEIRIRT